ncbi:hypothetical protein DFH09DRAFT_1112506 [Mycena vulgaris]|nr:hypothetical protein DFH09DRAFT_1112506 [Mycena vulgaris]
MPRKGANIDGVMGRRVLPSSSGPCADDELGLIASEGFWATFSKYKPLKWREKIHHPNQCQVGPAGNLHHLPERLGVMGLVLFTDYRMGTSLGGRRAEMKGRVRFARELRNRSSTKEQEKLHKCTAI